MANMWMYWSILLVCLLTSLTLADSSEFIVRNLPGRSALDTIHEIRRRLDHLASRSESRVLYQNSTSLNCEIRDKILYESAYENTTQKANGSVDIAAAIRVACTRCYTRGIAKAKLTVNGSFNTTQVTTELKGKTQRTLDSIQAFAKNLTDLVAGNVENFTIGEIKDEIRLIPPPKIDFNIDINLPGYDLEVEFEDTELYVALKLSVSAGLTYSLNVFTSSQAGIQIDKSLLLGVVFSIDLILSAEAKIDINSGFHIRLDDKLKMTLALFAKKASELTFHGGKFEFLPVTLESDDVVLKALLRLSVRAGFTLDTYDLHVAAAGKELKLAAGIEARAYVNVAEFTTNITARNGRELTSSKDCALHVVQDYTLAVGAAAGAKVEFLGTAYGPTPATEIPVFYSTLAASCVNRGSHSSLTTNGPELIRRVASDYFTTTTTEITNVYEATACLSPGLINCPASLQSIARNAVTKTLTATIASGSKAVWSTPAVTSFAAADFQKDILSFKGSSGVPKSYSPPPPPPPPPVVKTSAVSPAQGSPVLQGEAVGVSNRVIVGVAMGIGIGFGVTIIIAVIAGVCLVWTRKRREVYVTLAETSECEVARKKSPNKGAYSAIEHGQE
ncbi:hypothetical protein E4U42_004673 [Claviceps africana]|uniref:Mid2 domain-containing protein n=1 Tax=Claviceps africana TaxID=83212 RepID=A0A8K0JEI4_9HYPO|nr:hypothetical protein E4U42_004673 [Claviceps africana]